MALNNHEKDTCLRRVWELRRGRSVLSADLWRECPVRPPTTFSTLPCPHEGAIDMVTLGE